MGESLRGRPLRICIVSDSYPLRRPFGGVAVYTQTAARGLQARGHHVCVLSRTRADSAQYDDGPIPVTYQRLRYAPVIGRFTPGLGESWSLQKALRRLHAEHRFELVEFSNFEGLALVSELANFVPIAVRLHTSMAESVEAAERPPRWGERFLMWAEKQSARRALGVVTHSSVHRDRLAQIYGLERIHLIPHGIVLPEPRATEPATPAILTLGRLTARKGGATLLQAMATVLRAWPTARWTVVGAAETHALVQAFRRDHPDLGPERATFVEFVEGDELDALFRSATVYASASVYESFGLPFVEAMARGIPVVGCAAGAMIEVVQHDRAGLLVPPHDAAALSGAVERLLSDPALRTRLGGTGLRVAREDYSADRMSAEIESWYYRLLETSCHGR